MAEGELIEITFNDILKEYPEAEIWYLKNGFNSKLMDTIRYKTDRGPYFGSKKKLKYDKVNENFVDFYKSIFSYLPIDEWGEQALFKHFVMGALIEKGNKKEKILCNLAIDLTETRLFTYVQKLRVLDYLSDSEFDRIERHLQF